MNNKKATSQNSKAALTTTFNSNIMNTYTVTMNTIEIAEITSKRPDNVNRDAVKMLNELGLGLLKFEDTYLTKQGKTAKCYNLPKRECLILVSGYNMKIRAAIIDRLQVLEDSQPKFPQTLPDALRLAADLAEERLILLPKAQALDLLTHAEGTCSMTVAAKQLKRSPRSFIRWLEGIKWLYRDASNTPIAYQQKIDSGLLEMYTEHINGKARSQARVTAKGLTKLAELLGGV